MNKSRCVVDPEASSDEQCVGNTCKVPGCQNSNEKTPGRNGKMRGFCGKHFRQWRRTGNPLTRKELAREGFFKAVLDYAGFLTPGTRNDLAWAALRLAAAARNRPCPGGVSYAPEAAYPLLTLAQTYAAVPAEPECDAKFVEVTAALLEEALRFAAPFFPKLVRRSRS